MSKLTMPQIYTLRRIRNGGSAQIYVPLLASQRRRGRWYHKAIDCPSLPVLFRLGLVEITGINQRKIKPGFFYAVELTNLGYDALRDAQEEAKP